MCALRGFVLLIHKEIGEGSNIYTRCLYADHITEDRAHRISYGMDGTRYGPICIGNNSNGSNSNNVSNGKHQQSRDRKGTGSDIYHAARPSWALTVFGFLTSVVENVDIQFLN